MAKKYLISSLAEKCCQILEASIKPENVFVVLEQAIQFDEKGLEEKSWDIVSEKTQECLNSEAFCDIGLHTLNVLLKKKGLAVTEVELFKAVLKWTDSECAKQGINIEENKTARRHILGDSVYEIRFLAMSHENILKDIAPTGILTETETICILQKLLGLDVVELKWKGLGKRVPSPLVSFSRFVSGNVKPGVMLWNYYHRKSDALTLTVNKAVLFYGVRLFGDSGCSQYEVNFKIKEENVTGTYTSQKDGNGVPGYDVILPKPISLLPDKEITINATIKGPRSYYGEEGKSIVNVNDIVVTFEDSPVSKNGTKKTRGQFDKFFISEL